jgi:hypothetical protein
MPLCVLYVLKKKKSKHTSTRICRRECSMPSCLMYVLKTKSNHISTRICRQKNGPYLDVLCMSWRRRVSIHLHVSVDKEMVHTLKSYVCPEDKEQAYIYTYLSIGVWLIPWCLIYVMKKKSKHTSNRICRQGNGSYLDVLCMSWRGRINIHLHVSVDRTMVHTLMSYVCLEWEE